MIKYEFDEQPFYRNILKIQFKCTMEKAKNKNQNLANFIDKRRGKNVGLGRFTFFGSIKYPQESENPVRFNQKSVKII
jgi:hypothetical protein